jgi:acetylornithine deacetylase
MAFLENAFGDLNVDVERVALADALVSDPDYCSPIPDLEYDGRFNLRIARKGTGGGKTLLLNTHVDVVPPSPDMPEPWTPRLEHGNIFARGACDAKGQIATIFLVLKTLEALDAHPAGDVVAHLVVEEENGGNGSLAMVRRGEKADACICMEPSELKVVTSIRGAVWFKIHLHGRAGHSGQPGVAQNALLMARDVITALEDYHRQLLEGSRGIPLFNAFDDAVPLTFGRLEGGNWPATAPSDAVLEGVLGFLPNKSEAEVCREIAQAVAASGNGNPANHADLSFTFRHGCCTISPAEDLPKTLMNAVQSAGRTPEIAAANCSSDAWLYSNRLNIPTAQFGPGSLRVCHSRHEYVGLDDVLAAAEILTLFILDYCDGKKPCGH